MGLVRHLFKQKIKDISDRRRLAIVSTERALREGLNVEHLEAVRKAREEEFQNTPQIRRIEK